LVVKRYPHTATIKVITDVITNGEYAGKSESQSTIIGRLEPSEGGTTRVKHPDGDIIEVAAKFFTKSDVIAGADELTVDGRTWKIVYWPPLQSYSEIWLA